MIALITTVVAVVVCVYAVVDPLLQVLEIQGLADMLIESSALGSGHRRCPLVHGAAPAPGRRGARARPEPAARPTARRRRRAAGVRLSGSPRDGHGGHRGDRVTMPPERALDTGTPRLAAELLLADSSDAHLQVAAHAAPDGERPRLHRDDARATAPPSGAARPCCSHPAKRSTPAPTSPDRPAGDRAAACVPVSVGGRSIGVLHATVEPRRRPRPPSRCPDWSRSPPRPGPDSGCCA